MSHRWERPAPYLCTMTDSSVPIISSKTTHAGSPGAGDDLLDKAIGALYSTTGTTEQLTFRTTAEVRFELSDVIDATLGDIAKWMQRHECATRVVDGTLCWVLYDRRDPTRI